MPIKLSKREKVYLAALGGDMPEAARARLFRLGKLPVHVTAALAESRRRADYISKLMAMPKPPRSRRGFKWKDRPE